MNRYTLIFLIMLAAFSAKAQNLYLNIEGKDASETKIIDSLSYKKAHENAKSVADEAATLSNTLLRSGYLENRELSRNKINDSTFVFKISLGPKTTTLYIYTGTL
ncbi:MAG TPA: hypothetical protein VEA37_02825, partial [Flavobacterium sp.]|nr:hypothetical protein [Flavobacterium sp.]